MKINTLAICLLASSGLFVFSCSSDKKEETSSSVAQASVNREDIIAEEAVEVDSEILGVCVWDKLSVRATPGENGKWLTSLNLGEKVKYLDESSKTMEAGKEREYLKVELLDGKEGWVRSDLLIVDAQSAVILRDSDVYNRPDLLTKSDKGFSRFDIVALKNEKDGWFEVIGKRKGASWIESGYLRSGSLSVKDVDIAVAKFTASALATKDKVKRYELIQDIIDNPDFKETTFRPELVRMVEEYRMSLAAEVEDEAVEEGTESFID